MITNELKQKNHKFRKKILSYLNYYPTGEKFLIAFLVSSLADFIPFNKYPYIYDFEYFVEPPYSQFGKGDLILTSGRKYYLIVEAKFLDERTGPTPRAIRRRDRQKVREQAKKYGNFFQSQNPTFIVNYITLTNDYIQKNEHPEFAKVFQKFQNKKMKQWKQKHSY